MSEKLIKVLVITSFMSWLVLGLAGLLLYNLGFATTGFTIFIIWISAIIAIFIGCTCYSLYLKFYNQNVDDYIDNYQITSLV